MPQSQKRFTQEFQDEAVRLVETSGRSRRAIAEDLGVGVSTLRHWIDRRREREIDHPPEGRQEDMAGGRKRGGGGGGGEGGGEEKASPGAGAFFFGGGRGGVW